MNNPGGADQLFLLTTHIRNAAPGDGRRIFAGAGGRQLKKMSIDATFSELQKIVTFLSLSKNCIPKNHSHR